MQQSVAPRVPRVDGTASADVGGEQVMVTSGHGVKGVLKDVARGDDTSGGKREGGEGSKLNVVIRAI